MFYNSCLNLKNEIRNTVHGLTVAAVRFTLLIFNRVCSATVSKQMISYVAFIVVRTIKLLFFAVFSGISYKVSAYISSSHQYLLTLESNIIIVWKSVQWGFLAVILVLALSGMFPSLFFYIWNFGALTFLVSGLFIKSVASNSFHNLPFRFLLPLSR